MMRSKILHTYLVAQMVFYCIFWCETVVLVRTVKNLPYLGQFRCVVFLVHDLVVSHFVCFLNFY
jgi:hypothetical protein